jgi:hypothetical protein
MDATAPGMDGGILPWTVQCETLNQLVEGSSPSRLTELFKESMTESRADGRGSSVVREEVATRSVCEE